MAAYFYLFPGGRTVIILRLLPIFRAVRVGVIAGPLILIILVVLGWWVLLLLKGIYVRFRSKPPRYMWPTPMNGRATMFTNTKPPRLPLLAIRGKV